ncbi:SH3 domain-containing protein [Hufsiella ginkgonis]|uniref:SH3 domain-containing protein n=1 Tax=Hufsiella ginkgonis TaxID=2695274 RepID=A0A7K1Y0P7_9SPHI|nr:SH3 domain-containing protein [Hufsiella ginkgonis]MXV16667.1 SH3 domain-containing protein [Hufsiella ginkgonis]
MGLFDEVNKAVVNQQQVNDYAALLQKSGITVTNLKAVNAGGKLTVSGVVADMQSAEKAVELLKTQAGVTEVVNLLEMEDLTAKNIKMRVATNESNLNIRKGPGTEFEIVGKAAHNSTVQLIKRMYNDWYYIKTEQGVEGFSAKNYLQQV